MLTERRKQLAIGGAVVVLVLAGYWMFGRQPSAEPAPASNQRTPGTSRRNNAAAPPEAPDVHLEALERERPKPTADDRDLFRFKPKPPPPPPPKPVVVAPPPPPVPTGPPPPPPLPQITLKFIGTMTQGGKTVAVLSDGVGQPVFGVEGGTVLGRYKILRIGVESIEMSYADGRGRQTIRLSGG